MEASRFSDPPVLAPIFQQSIDLGEIPLKNGKSLMGRIQWIVMIVSAVGSEAGTCLLTLY